VRETRGFIHED
jgi:hypothetical protein